jgi:DNA uptake protein ComE-like DNA-binding protein
MNLKALWFSRWILTLAVAAGLCSLAACSTHPQQSSQQDQELRENAEKATEKAKQEAQQAAAEAKTAAAEAERKLDAVASGVKEGMREGSTDKPGAGRVDLNSASEDDLTTLPGISHSRARAIIDGRPFNSPHELVARHLLTESQYERISSRVTAR